MKKSELRTGMIVELRNHSLYMVLLDTIYKSGEYNGGAHDDILLSVTNVAKKNNKFCKTNGCCGYMNLKDYNDDLTFTRGFVDNIDDEDWDIIGIYSHNYCAYMGIKINYFDEINNHIIDINKKRMTISEIEKELGYNIELIEE